MLGGGQNTIPSINVTTEFPSAHHVFGLLCPPYPVLSDLSDSGSVRNHPPPPTLSNDSGPFPSTLQLRDNKPEEKSGLSSLDLLNPDSFGRHRGSASTSIIDIARSDDVHHAHSNTTSVTNVDQFSHSPIDEKKVSYTQDQKSVVKKLERGRRSREVDDIEEDQTDHQIKLTQDAAIDTSPFRFKPYELAHMLDPEGIETRVRFGGINGLPHGLGAKRLCDLTIRRAQSHKIACDVESSERERPYSMIQGKKITISGGKFNNVGGDYHEHNTYVIEESATHPKYLKRILDTIKKLEAKVNQWIPSSKKDNTKSNDSKQIQVEIENVSDMNPCNDDTIIDEIHFNSLNDPPPSASEFEDEYCIYQTPTPTPTRINNFAPSSSETQQPYPFGCTPVLVPGILHYVPCWFPSLGGWIASWTTWMSPPSWVWPSFLRL